MITKIGEIWNWNYDKWKFLAIDFQSGDLYDRYNSNVQEKCLIGLREGIQTPEIIYVTFDSSCFCVGCKKYLPIYHVQKE